MKVFRHPIQLVGVIWLIAAAFSAAAAWNDFHSASWVMQAPGRMLVVSSIVDLVAAIFFGLFGPLMIDK